MGWGLEGDSAFVPGGESKNSKKIKEAEDVSEARRNVGNIMQGMQGFDNPTSRPGSVQSPYSPRPGTFPVHALDSPSSRPGSDPVLLGQAQYSPHPGSVQLRMVPGLVRESSGLDLWKSSTGSSPFGGMEGEFGVDDIQAHIILKKRSFCLVTLHGRHTRALIFESFVFLFRRRRGMGCSVSTMFRSSCYQYHSGS